MITSPSIWGSLVDAANNNVIETVGSGAPTNGTSGTGVGLCGPGSGYTDITNNNVYMNIGTMASPIWFSLNVGVLQVIRTRVAIADVNAGLSLLPAILGYKYQLIEATAIAVGGAATTGTTVDILATQAASSVKLAAFAQASLTQSTVLQAGASGGAVLADGASFVPNDSNTAITINKTGSSFTVVTSIDVILQYIIVKG